MFCKWCGAQIPSAQTKCRHCGKEQPPLSECGGIYHFVSNSEPASSESNRTAMPNRPQDQGGSSAHHNGGKKASAFGANHLVVILSVLACTILIAVMLLVMRAQMKKVESKTDSLAEQVEALQSELAPYESKTEAVPPAENIEDVETETIPLAEDYETEPLEETESTEKTLSQKDITFSFDYQKPGFTEDNAAGEATDSDGLSAACDLAGFPLLLAVNTNNPETEGMFTLIGTSSLEDEVVMEASLRMEERRMEDYYVIRAQCDVRNEELFGAASPEDIDYVISWRRQGGSEWNPLPEQEINRSMVSETEAIPGCVFKIRSNAGCFMVPSELRCTITRRNSNGGSMTIYIGSLYFDPETIQY